MEQPQLNRIANFIWGIADDVLRFKPVADQIAILAVEREAEGLLGEIVGEKI